MKKHLYMMRKAKAIESQCNAIEFLKEVEASRATHLYGNI